MRPPSTGLPEVARLQHNIDMTIDERFERIEHVTAGLAEERRKDREDFRGLWRDTQRQINEVSVRLSEVSGRLSDLTVQVAELGDRIQVLAEESREADKRLEERIGSMVSAMGAFILKQQEGRP